MTEKIKCLIIGSGPAGFTAAIYASRANLSPVVYEGLQPGGQLTITTEIENFPGYPNGVTGPEMMNQLREQAKRFGTDVRSGIITEVDFSKRPFRVVTDGGNEIEAEVVIIATGATANYLGLESEQKLKGFGVSACATCDGFFYRKKDVAVVGGGDTAAEEATYLAGICNKVYMIVRRDELRASKAMQKRVMENPKIEVLWNCNTKEVLGNEMDGVTGARLLNNKTNEEKVIDISGFFVAIGHTPNTKVFAKYIDLDEKGYIKTIPGTAKTNVPGVFACGDVQDPNYRQAITAAGSGCKAAIDAEHFLLEY
ncbi:MAG: thioredoxin-disulfide reductase [Bacteroidales bacterium]|nr:thioredoxin-disulfide reductase [Bacteroidales bacterium]MBQ2543166.1 thioredoxin-disulfide reductase [Bacteroidales bacterium]MBQ4010755.1 thioredoxin-disulfide reductase [Bacteroidales bacterium]MBQ5457329.1 thioredoxin-disulfide reductase [Bacteroidales bacterium]